jgi:hypothetical protein
VALVVDGRNEPFDRSPLSGRNFLKRSRKCILYGHAGFIPVQLDAPFTNQGFSARGFGWRHRRLWPAAIKQMAANSSTSVTWIGPPRRVNGRRRFFTRRFSVRAAWIALGKALTFAGGQYHRGDQDN